MQHVIGRAGLAALIMLICSACGGGGNAPDTTSAHPAPDFSPAAAAPAAGLAGFSGPLELLRHISTGPSDNDRWREASDYENQLPFNRLSTTGGGKKGSVIDLGSTATFSPVWTGQPGEPLSNAAYGTYVFHNMDIYSGDARILLDWETAPADPAEVYLGLGNFSSNRWDWKPLVDGASLALADFAPYISPTGEILAVVLVLGSDTPKLNWLLAGESLNPTVYLNDDLNSDPTQNLAPLTINFNTSGSFDIGSSMGSYDWDFDSDGNYEIEGDTVGEASHQYLNPGAYTCTVHGVTADGKASTASLSFTAVDPANQAPVANLLLDKASGSAPLMLHMDGSTSTDDGQIVNYEWDLDDDGYYEYETGSTAFIDHSFGEMGVHTIHLRITDNDFASTVATVPFTVTNGWNKTVVAGGLQCNSQLGATVTGQPGMLRACIAWQDFANHDLFFARAVSEDGSAWGAPVAPVDNSLNTGYGLAMVPRNQGGPPLLAYGIYEQDLRYTLHLVRATDASGSSWNPPVDVAMLRNIGALSSMAMLAGVPVIWSVDVAEGTNDQSVRFYRAKDAEGSAWNLSVKVANAIPSERIMSLSGGVNAGMPYIFCTRTVGGNNFINCLYNASLADGSDWDPEINPAGADGYRISAKMVNGRPALAWGNSGSGASSNFVRANDSAGTDWPGSSVEVAASDLGGAPSLAVVGGIPAMAFYCLNQGSIQYATATDTDGSGWNQPYEIAQVTGEYGVQLMNVNGKPVVCTYDTTSDAVVALWFQP